MKIYNILKRLLSVINRGLNKLAYLIRERLYMIEVKILLIGLGLAGLNGLYFLYLLFADHKLYQILSPHLRDISPVELKLYLLLFFLCDDSNKCCISTYDLAQKANIKWKNIENSLEELKKRWLVDCTLDNNPFQEIVISLSPPVDNSLQHLKRKKQSIDI